MHDKHTRGGRKAIHDSETITSATTQPDRPPCPARSYAKAISEINQDTAEPAILFRPRLHWVPE